MLDLSSYEKSNIQPHSLYHEEQPYMAWPYIGPIKQVFWLPDRPRAAPSRPVMGSGIVRPSSPVTAAGPLPHMEGTEPSYGIPFSPVIVIWWR